ncbi:MAG TPA: hypothetical protein VED63_12640, partial [Acidimicrobiales bacterium]|nr:hypothetical protein [Acidimicrobiales bacterium]
MTPIAVGGALGAVLFSMVMEGSNPMVLFKPAPLILVFVGTAMAAAAGFMKNDVTNITNVVKQAMGSPEHSPEEDIARMV